MCPPQLRRGKVGEKVGARFLSKLTLNYATIRRVLTIGDGQHMATLHDFLFSWQMIYSFVLGIYATILAARSQGLSGNFWGAVAIYPILNIIVLAIGGYLWFTGYTVEDIEHRVMIYFLYMLFLIVIMPGLFSMLHGRDDPKVIWYFVGLALFNASVSFSMQGRGLASWVLQS